MEWRYLLKNLKENFETSESDLDLSDLNYKVGNTSGMDVTGDIPSAIAERVGQLAQRGGGEMEIQITNPTSFHIDREPLYNTIQQLGLDISIHSDPNVGYTAAYKTGQGRGYDVTHNFFTKYLQEFASFKVEAENREDLDFNISRVNPHISTDEIPALKERMAQDVGLDPFGYPISEYNERYNSMRDREQKNMFKNKEFMKKFYKVFLLDEVNEPYQLYGLFAQFSEKFRDDYWKDARKEACNELYEDFTGVGSNPSLEEIKTSVEDKYGLIRTARQTDVGIEQEWREIATGDKGDFENPVNLPQLQNINVQSIDSLDDLKAFSAAINQATQLSVDPLTFSNLTRLDQSRFNLENDFGEAFEQITDSDKRRKLVFETENALKRCLNKLWKGNGDEYLISVRGKISALNNRYDIPEPQIHEKAQRMEGDRLEEGVESVLTHEEGFYERSRLYHDLMDRLMRSFEQALWMESNIFYKIAPAWMSSSNKEYYDEDGETVHKAFEAPEFIWNVMVEERHEDFEFGDDYLQKLEEDDDFRRDVASASGALYMWSHFTQRLTGFEMDGNEHVEEDYGNYTWLEWMNKYGIGINFEAMAGNPQTEFKLWRPKDMVAACRAVNITARNDLDEMHPALYDCPLKFTIDMEHTASFGGEPWKQMQALIDQEEWLAESDWSDKVKIDGERPLADIVRMYHLTKPGLETSQGTGHIHGPFREGDEQLYTWLHDMVANGFAQADERASVMYEVGGDQTGTVQKAKLSMNMIELGIKPGELEPANVDPGKKEYRDEREALMARFFGMDRPSYNREWAKIEQHAFDPLQGLLEAPEFDYTFSSMAAVKNDKMREWPNEEFK